MQFPADGVKGSAFYWGYVPHTEISGTKNGQVCLEKWRCRHFATCVHNEAHEFLLSSPFFRLNSMQRKSACNPAIITSIFGALPAKFSKKNLFVLVCLSVCPYVTALERRQNVCNFTLESFINICCHIPVLVQSDNNNENFTWRYRACMSFCHNLNRNWRLTSQIFLRAKDNLNKSCREKMNTYYSEYTPVSSLTVLRNIKTDGKKRVRIFMLWAQLLTY
jgi:hypothetical protein